MSVGKTHTGNLPVVGQITDLFILFFNLSMTPGTLQNQKFAVFLLVLLTNKISS